MTAKEFLQQYINANNEISAKLDQVWQLRELVTKTTETLSPDRVSSCGEKDKISAIVSKIVDMENEIDSDIDRLIDIKKQVEDIIASISDSRLRNVLFLRYINGLRWEEIAVKLNYDYSWVLRLHGLGLAETNKRLKTNKTCVIL